MSYRRIYEINTRVWLAELVAARTIPAATLAAIPESYIDLWRRWQVDADLAHGSVGTQSVQCLDGAREYRVSGVVAARPGRF